MRALRGGVVLLLGLLAACGPRDDRAIGRAATTTTRPAPATTATATTAPATVPGTTTEPATTVAGTLLAIDVLRTIPVTNEHRGGYDRERFGAWSDLDHDGCDTRQEVLAAESIRPPLLAADGCDVEAGEWSSAYDGLDLTDPHDVEIDHVVSLKETWDSGAWAWSDERLVAYGNDQTDPRTLAAVSGSSNSSKGDRDPSNWLPVDEDRCAYVDDWIAIKARWGLSMDQSEWGRLKNLLTDDGPCVGTAVEAWPPAP